MSKAEKFIEDYTRRYSNAIAQPGGMWDSGGFEVVYQPWITPEDALSAVEIAKEEVKEQMMKDMPRWKKVDEKWLDNSGWHPYYIGDKQAVYHNGYAIELSELESLPKEGEK